MSKRYDLIDYCSYRDNETGKISDNFVGVLNQQDQKIKELEHRLSNCIEPKFKIGQEVYWIDSRMKAFNELFTKIGYDYTIKSFIVDAILISNDKPRYYGTDGLWLFAENIFATEEEAKKHLEELKNG